MSATLRDLATKVLDDPNFITRLRADTKGTLAAMGITSKHAVTDVQRVLAKLDDKAIEDIRHFLGHKGVKGPN